MGKAEVSASPVLFYEVREGLELSLGPAALNNLKAMPAVAKGVKGGTEKLVSNEKVSPYS